MMKASTLNSNAMVREQQSLKESLGRTVGGEFWWGLLSLKCISSGS